MARVTGNIWNRAEERTGTSLRTDLIPCIGAIFLARHSGLAFRDPPSLITLRNQAVSCGR